MLEQLCLMSELEKMKRQVVHAFSRTRLDPYRLSKDMELLKTLGFAFPQFPSEEDDWLRSRPNREACPEVLEHV